MRTSRVSPVPSSIFRNSRQYLHSNELFQRILEEGHHFSSNHQHQQQNQNKSSQNKHPQPTRVVLNRTSKGTVIKGLFVDCNEILQIQNSLLERATKISEVRNKAKYLRSYRSSI